MTIRNKLIKLHWILSSQFGIDPRYFLRSLRGLLAFMRDLRQFRQDYSGRMGLMPCFHDRYEEGGITHSEYFWQDLLVARWIYETQPLRHVDVGSRVDGFIAHIASFREIEVFDVRPISTQIPGVVFKQMDFMQTDSLFSTEEGYCDSLSCLHAIEHFGLGRYGDPIDSRGYKRGIANMAKLIKPGGRFYLSTPIGQERVEFNSHWVFDPRTIIHCADVNGLKLQKLKVINSNGVVLAVKPTADKLRDLGQNIYNLGIFVFVKSSG